MRRCVICRRDLEVLDCGGRSISETGSQLRYDVARIDTCHSCIQKAMTRLSAEWGTLERFRHGQISDYYSEMSFTQLASFKEYRKLSTQQAIIERANAANIESIQKALDDDYLIPYGEEEEEEASPAPSCTDIVIADKPGKLHRFGRFMKPSAFFTEPPSVKRVLLLASVTTFACMTSSLMASLALFTYGTIGYLTAGKKSKSQ